MCRDFDFTSIKGPSPESGSGLGFFLPSCLYYYLTLPWRINIKQMQQLNV